MRWSSPPGWVRGPTIGLGLSLLGAVAGPVEAAEWPAGIAGGVARAEAPAAAEDQAPKAQRRRRNRGVTAAYRRMRARWHAPPSPRARAAFREAEPKPLVLIPVASGRRRVLYPIGGRPRDDDPEVLAARLAAEEAEAAASSSPSDPWEGSGEGAEGGGGDPEEQASGLAEDEEAAIDEVEFDEEQGAQEGDEETRSLAASAPAMTARDADELDPWARVEALLDQDAEWTDAEAAFVEAMMERVDGHVGGPIPPWDEITPGVSRFDDPDELELAEEALAYRKDGSRSPIHPRLLELVYRAVLHFEAPYVHVISGYRPTRRTSRHSQGRAMDIVLPGVRDAELARFFRKQGFVGVGLYPASGFVHVDVRRHSYFWVDRSGPGRRQRPRRILADYGQRMDAEAWARGERPFGRDGGEDDDDHGRPTGADD